MSFTQSIFKIHSTILAKSDQRTADEYIRLLIDEKIRDLQNEGRFNPKNLESVFQIEAESFSHWDLKKVS